MILNFNSLKVDFIDFLKKQNIIDSSDEDYNSTDDISIFKYAKEFKEFMTQEQNIDVSELTASVSDLMAMVQFNSDSVDISQDTDIDSEETQENAQGQNKNILNKIFNNFLNDKNFFKQVDQDQNGEISDKEKELFFNSIAKLDENAEDISFTDMFLAAENMQNNDETVSEINLNENPIQESEITSSQMSSPSAGGGNYQSAGGTNVYNPQTNNDLKTDDDSTSINIDKMTKEELNTELSDRKSKLSEKEQKLSSIVNDSDSDLSAKKEEAEKAYNEYKNQLEVVEPSMAEELQTYKDSLDAKDEEINEQNKAISEQEKNVSDAKASYQQAKNTEDSLTAQLSSLKSKKSSNLTAEQSSELDAKISAAEKQLGDAKEKVIQAEKNVKTQEEEETKRKNELVSLEKEKDTINEKKTKFEKALEEKYPEIAQLKDKYNSLQNQYDSEKSQKVAKAQQDILDAKNKVNEVETAISKCEDKKNIKDNLSFNNEPDLYVDDLETDISFIKDENGLQYLVYGPKTPDPNIEYPLMVNVPGGSEFGSDAEKLTNVNYGKFMKNMSDSDGAKFNGYMICVMLPSFEHWTNDRNTGRVDDVVDKFTQTHNINKDKIALSGFSHGANGALYMGSHSRNKYCSVALMSCPGGINNGNVQDIQNRGTQVYGFLGSSAKGELKTSLEYMKHEFINQAGADHLYQVDADHGQVVDYSFNMDNNGDGIPDVFQILFGNNE